ncbi:MAG: MCE family protein [Pyrinomonadaceae bacterium]|nr:MCE family protein [Pyrinomonadaceae bacterium]MBP6213886.1 MCE family protein [Pyrinomonadaceae bacterium]
MPKTNQRLTISELRVGIFMLAALLVFGFLIINSSGDFNPFEKRMNLRVRFASADGLHSNADVQLAGIPVGKVKDVKFLPPDSPAGERIEATLSVVQVFENKPIGDLIRTDSTAQLIATSVLGNEKMINISPGTAKGEPVVEDTILASNSAISMNQLTATGNDLLKQINKLAIPANEILNKANQGDGTLGRIINDEALYESLDGAVAETRSTMTRLQTTIDKINRGGGTAGKLVNDPALYDSLNKTVASLEAISADIKAGKGSAGKFVSDDALYNETRATIADLRKSVVKINEIAEDIKIVTTDLKDGKGTAGKFLKDEALYQDVRDAIAKFNSTTTRIEAVIADAQAGKGTLGKFVTDETLYNNINQTASTINQFSSEGTKLLYDFRQNPKKFLRIKVALF